MRKTLISLLLLFPSVAFASGNVFTHSTNCATRTPTSADQLCIQQTTPPKLFCANSEATAFAECGGGDLCLSGLGCLRTNGVDLYLDADADSTLDANEPNLTMNAPVGTSGDETVQGDLTVAGAFTVAAVTKPFESPLMEAGTGGTAPTTGQCLQAGTFVATFQSCANGVSYIAPFKLHLTRFSAFAQGGATLTGSCIIHLRDETATTNLASITFAPSGGNLTHAEGQFYSATVGVDVAAGHALRFYSDATTCAPGAWSKTVFQTFGYGAN